MLKKNYSVATLLGLRLNCLPSTKQNIYLKAEREGWPFVEVPGKGGVGGVRREFEVPSYVLDEIITKVGEISASTDKIAAAMPKNVVHIHKGQIMDDTRLLALCVSTTDKMNETHQLGMGPDKKGEVVALLYKYMIQRRSKNEDAAKEEITQFLNVFKR